MLWADLHVWRSDLLNHIEEIPMTLATVLLVVLIVMLVAAIPSWPYSQSWGYWPSGGLGLVVLVVIILLLMGRI